MNTKLTDKQIKVLMLFSSCLFDVFNLECDILYWNKIFNSVKFNEDNHAILDYIFENASYKDSQILWNLVCKVESRLYLSLFGISLNEIHHHFKCEWLNYDDPSIMNSRGIRDPNKFKGLKIHWDIDLNRVNID